MQPEITSTRLRLEPLRLDHTEGVVKVFDDPASSRYFPTDLSDETTARAMIRRRLSYDGPAELGHWAWLCDDEVVGLGHLRPSWELPSALVEIGWYVSPRYGGHGLATEGAAALLDYGLRRTGLPAVWAIIHPDNRPSIALANRLGFLDVGQGDHYGAIHEVHVRLPDPTDDPTLLYGRFAGTEAARQQHLPVDQACAEDV